MNRLAGVARRAHPRLCRPGLHGLHGLHHGLRPSSSAATPATTAPCCHAKQAAAAATAPPPPLPLTALAFWQSPVAWRRASLNTLRCLVGCSLGDMSAMWYLQAYHADWGMWPAIMGAAIACGLASSVTLETVLLRLGPDRLPWPTAARTAVGMSFLSMVTMEAVENAVDWHLTAGAGVALAASAPAQFWGAAAASLVAGFLAPLPYNYARLRRYGKSCH